MDHEPAAEPLYTPENYNPEDSLGRLIADVSRSILAGFDEELATQGMGITGAQWVILMRIARGCATTAAELCRFGHCDTGSMTRMLDRLEEKGLIRRVPSSRDRRITRLELTEAGQELLPHLPPVAVKVLNAHLKGFSRTELDQLKGFLNRIRANSGLPA
ncbi:MarR family winged helix-turn-helix transcriptional regulator [Geothrix fermentans]|jgi:DNA-binding MarR family transcriptional regulator|uniref:MarR family winged helix-turn-helix transcriptional regulator n=1 Tax=Geothrix fermentans TaxID=44676 RepID=UPI0004040CC5|nr:MarR family transcriptional regulator [Geothrix fermentans]